MKTKQQTVLITGGGSGIGFEIAKLFSHQGNQVILVGRNKQRLERAAGLLSGATYLVCDVSKKEQIDLLAAQVKELYPNLSILINNAGQSFAYRLGNGEITYQYADEEMKTNFLATAHLTESLLPVLKNQEVAAIVNVTSITAFVPSAAIPTYSASKAALHSYTQALRLTLLPTTRIQVFELMPPLVNTEFSKEIGGENGIPPTEVAQALLQAMHEGVLEIHVSGTKDLYSLFRTDPDKALRTVNRQDTEA